MPNCYSLWAILFHLFFLSQLQVLNFSKQLSLSQGIRMSWWWNIKLASGFHNTTTSVFTIVIDLKVFFVSDLSISVTPWDSDKQSGFHCRWLNCQSTQFHHHYHCHQYCWPSSLSTFWSSWPHFILHEWFRLIVTKIQLLIYSFSWSQLLVSW